MIETIIATSPAFDQFLEFVSFSAFCNVMACRAKN